MNCPCEGCICFPMCLNKSLVELTSCKIFQGYVNVENVYQKYDRLKIMKELFIKHGDGFIPLISSLMRDIREFVSYTKGVDDG
ncbi:MAG: hypothetical protein ACTSW1_07750 [Candidatus Hodarchaeales archaeon]